MVSKAAKDARRGWGGYTWWLEDWRGSKAFRALSPEERSCYRELCEWQWTESGKAGKLVGLRDDDEELSAMAGVSLERWVAIKLRVMRWMTLSEDGWHNKKVDEEVNEKLRVLVDRSSAGSKGAAGRWQSDGKAMANGCESHRFAIPARRMSGDGCFELNSPEESGRASDARAEIFPRKNSNDDASAAATASGLPGSPRDDRGPDCGWGRKISPDAALGQPGALPSVGKISHLDDFPPIRTFPATGDVDVAYEVERIVKRYGELISTTEAGRGRARVLSILYAGTDPQALVRAIENYAKEIRPGQELKRSCASFFRSEEEWTMYADPNYVPTIADPELAKKAAEEGEEKRAVDEHEEARIAQAMEDGGVSREAAIEWLANFDAEEAREAEEEAKRRCIITLEQRAALRERQEKTKKEAEAVLSERRPNVPEGHAARLAARRKAKFGTTLGGGETNGSKGARPGLFKTD